MCCRFRATIGGAVFVRRKMLATSCDVLFLRRTLSVDYGRVLASWIDPARTGHGTHFIITFCVGAHDKRSVDWMSYLMRICKFEGSCAVIMTMLRTNTIINECIATQSFRTRRKRVCWVMFFFRLKIPSIFLTQMRVMYSAKQLWHEYRIEVIIIAWADKNRMYCVKGYRKCLGDRKLGSLVDGRGHRIER